MILISEEKIKEYEDHLKSEEKGRATIEKYVHDIRTFVKRINKESIEKSDVIEYKEYLAHEYKPASVNSVISSLNSFFAYNEWYECKVKSLKIQKRYLLQMIKS